MYYFYEALKGTEEYDYICTTTKKKHIIQHVSIMLQKIIHVNQRDSEANVYYQTTACVPAIMYPTQELLQGELFT